MSFTGFLAIIVGGAYSVFVDRSQIEIIGRWHDATIFDISDDQRPVIEARIFRTSMIAQLSTAAFILIVTVIGYTNFYSDLHPLSEFVIASFICATLIGLRLGRLASHGWIGRTLKVWNIRFSMTGEHTDRAGGLAQVGNFYLLQASVLIVPILWLLAWSILIPSLDSYSDWGNLFSIFLAVSSQ